MNLATFSITVFIAAAYVAWPNLSKPLGVSPGLIAFIVIVAALVVILITAPREIAQIRTMPPKAMFWIVAIAIANGVAIYLQASRAADPHIATGIFLVTIFLLQTAFAPIVDWLINGTSLTPRQMAGLALAMPTMWLLAKV